MAKRLFNTGSPSDSGSDRRVEPRSAISGSGMMADPERIRALEDEQRRRERASRARTRSFSDSLTQSSYNAMEEEEEQDDLTELTQTEEISADEFEGDHHLDLTQEEALDEEEVTDSFSRVGRSLSRTGGPQSTRGPAQKRERTLPRVPPDPRASLLNEQLDSIKNKKDS